MQQNSQADAALLYNEAYYASHCGSIPYARTDHWLSFFGGVADVLVRSFAPARVFDAGCAIGLLVECLWDRGVEAHGRDISPWAIDQVRADVRPWCQVGSIADPIEGTYDLITCIEVLEHIPEADARRAVTALSAAAPRILFSSSPTDLTEPTHITVRPPAYWLALWAEAGFAPSVSHDAGYLAPHAYVLERSEEGRSRRDLVGFADRVRHRVALSQVGSAMLEARSQLVESQRTVRSLQSQLAAMEGSDRSAVDDLRDLQDDLAQAQARIASEFAARSVAEAQIMSLRREAETTRNAMLVATSAHQAILASTTWRATAVVRRASNVLPRQFRHLARRVLLAGWLASARGLARRLAERRRNIARARMIAASSLFDRDWYLARNPDVAASGISPALHYAQSGEAEGRDPGPAFNARLALRHQANAAPPPEPTPTQAADERPPVSDAPIARASTRNDIPPPASAMEIARAARFPDLAALPVFGAPHAGGRRLTVVTDSINVGSLYGGVGTALIFAALAAGRLGASLRVVTRTEPPDAGDVAGILRAQGIAWDGNIEFVYAPRQAVRGGHDVPASDGDLFLTTSWWTTWATRQSIQPARIAYLLQEDERMFYPHGDDSLQCAETLADPNVLFIVNSELLLGHLKADGLAPNGIAFEPSFPSGLYHPAPAVSVDGKRDFFFYARPNNPRNLYWRGLEVMVAAIEEGVLSPDEWNFHFAGHGAASLTLPRGAQPLFPGPMAWQDYAAFIRRMEIGLSLMYTPHPSYPPLDIAASGGIVVTNRFGRKRDLDRYSANIICADPDTASLVSALRRATELAADTALRKANFTNAGLQRDWTKSMAPALARLVAWAGH